MDPFEDLYRRHFWRVWTALLRLGVDRADLEDAVQDVFVVAVRRRDAFTPGSSVRAWLLGISRRVASDHRRRRQRHHRRVDGLRRLGPEPTVSDDASWCFEGIRLLQRFLAALDDEKREIFVLVELEQLTGREAAALLGLNRNTAVARLRAARRAFDEYARRLQRSPPGLLAAARREVPPQPRVRRRVLGLLMLRLHDSAGGAGPAPGLGGLASATTWKAAMISFALAGATLGGIRLASTWWSSSHSPTHAPDQPASLAGVHPRPPSTHTEPTGTAPTGTEHRDSERASVARGAPPAMHEAPSSNPAQARPRRASSPAPVPARDDDVDPLLVQGQALEQARLAVRSGEPQRALSIVAAVTQAHPTGALALELALVRVDALCARGLHAQARGEARVLQQTHPGSPVAALADCPELVDP